MNHRKTKTGLTLVLVAWWAVAAAFSIGKLVVGTELLATWLGVAMASLAPLIFVSLRRYQRSPDQTPQPLGFSIICGLGLAIAMTMSWRYGTAAGSAHISAGASLIGWAFYLRWLRSSERTR